MCVQSLHILWKCWRRAGLRLMETAASSVFLCLTHKAKHTKTNRISRFGLHHCRFRQLPPHMLALVAQLLPNATIKPLKLWQSELLSHVVTTLLKSTCSSMFNVQVPLELRDFTLFISFWGARYNHFFPIRACDWTLCWAKESGRSYSVSECFRCLRDQSLTKKKHITFHW